MSDRIITFIKDDEVYRTPDVLPILPLRDVVVFPYMVIPLMVGRPSSVAGIACRRDRPYSSGRTPAGGHP